MPEISCCGRAIRTAGGRGKSRKAIPTSRSSPQRHVPFALPLLLAAGIAPNHDVFAGLAGALGRQRDGWRNPIENPLPAFLGLGRRAADGDVQECLKLLAETQNDDGGWPYFAGDESHADPTAAAVTLLRKYRLDLPT